MTWRKEIFEGIERAAKMVMFVDREYLLSFNCLQEVAYAQELNKPIVVVILDQESMDILTDPTGAERAWTADDAVGGVLNVRDGHELLPAAYRADDVASKLSVLELRRMFKLLSEINFCCCREQDFQTKTAKVVLSAGASTHTPQLEPP